MASQKTAFKKNRSRVSLSLEMKLNILDALQDGKSVANVGRNLKINESTVRTIKKNQDSIRQTAAQGTIYATKSSSYTRDPLMVKMEKALHMWIEDHAQKKIPLDQELIREKALSLYLWLEKNEPSSSKKKDFTASKGWFYNFIRSNSIRNVKIKGESASADVSAANSFPPKLAKIIKEGAYHGDQVFNGDETGLFWKRMPSRTYITQQEQYASGFKAAKDRVTLLFCSNASGDLMLKPLLINRAMTPRSLKGADFNKLPVHWKANTKAWVTKAVFEEWFYDMFIPEVKTYLEGKGLEFHVLLILDNAPGHLVIKHPNVQVVFLPPNTTSLLQPQDQGIIAAFKKLYIKQCLRYILEKLESDETMTVIQAWKEFKIRDALTFIGKALSSMKSKTLNSCWKPLWPECVKAGSTDPSNVEESEILILAHAIGGKGFKDMDSRDVEELLEDTEIEDDELMQSLVTSEPLEDDEDRDIKPCDIEDGNKLADTLVKHFMEKDPCVERAVSFRNDLKLCMLRYNRLNEKTQPTVIDEDDEDFSLPLERRRSRPISSDEEDIATSSNRKHPRVANDSD
ncbi:tigger transposable element-derived protein 1-like [Toxorhynchites rutilus septentrionalis]|uniref:tigger transposable element-derived protein 1-like n=7 Tax=Toxorhynchites rutilus septentrionalis TaxID=329112 RepID=UPI002479BFCD|nr:tigger transposable element-derived protein 1-like [Toxorhynchites rutilus septentrionalis]XP_055619393.1 tigger transposable element-derived protein 1-like [Toxorhynchites rutilus septentrionalis]XP_055619402.1 tigger transposable element-derived protein 1-like [Toxorhynchites rutilus septentrionalis]XP_055626839.1 tigger transposable element-derived protein 1-like [Toxorhynchites rutilus septentrionalis]XP_055631364.1 tigger transposable element-derived protein 1-like [Toxorhynchites rutil